MLPALAPRQPPAGAPLSFFVGHVVTMRSQEQVRGVTAWRVVAGMTDTQPGWDRAVGHFPGDAMCASATRSADQWAPIDYAVAIWTTRPLPQPTVSVAI